MTSSLRAVAVAAAVLAATAGACAATDGDQSPTTVRGRPSTPAASTLDPPTDPATMPDLVGLPSTAAGRRIGELDAITQLGLGSSWRSTPVRCDVQPGTVVSQRPRAGSPLRDSQTIHVRTAYLDLEEFRGPCDPAGGDLGPVRGPDAALARRFYRFAADPELGAPFAPEPVWTGIGSGSTATWVSVAGRAQLAAWELDTLYAERGGPFSALDVVASSGGYFELHRGTVTGCAGEVSDPPAMKAFRSISLTSPRETTDACMDWWSVTLYLDEDDLIRGVALRLGSP